MNPRLDISARYMLSAFSSMFSSSSKSDCEDSFSPYDGNVRYKHRSTSASAIELPQVAAGSSEEQQKSENVQYGFRMVYVCAMASMFCALCAGFSTIYAGPATYDMQTRKDSRIKVTDDDVSWIGSTLSIGMLAAIPFAVYLADRIGRKEILIFNTIPFTISWLIIIYAPNSVFLIIGRLFGGWASAVVYVVLPMYAVEISSADTRGLIGASFQSCVGIGSLMTMGLGAVLAWSWLAVAGLVTVVISLIVFCPMPESPRWLVAHGMKENAISAIKFLHADKIDAETECQMIQESLKTQTSSKFSIQNFRQPIIYKPTLISLGQMVFVQFSGSTVVILFSSMILDNAHSSMNPKISTVIVGAVQVIFTILSSLVMDKVGRRILLLSSGFLMCISQAALGAYFYVSRNDHTLSSKVGWLPLTVLLVYIAVFSIGFGPIPFLMLSEMVPTRERSFVSGLAICFISALSFIAVKTFEDLKNLIGFHGVFWTYATFCFLSCLFVYFFVPETKGKQLEEIQNIFRRAPKPTAADGGLNSSKSGNSNPSFSETLP